MLTVSPGIIADAGPIQGTSIGDVLADDAAAAADSAGQAHCKAKYTFTGNKWYKAEGYVGFGVRRRNGQYVWTSFCLQDVYYTKYSWWRGYFLYHSHTNEYVS